MDPETSHGNEVREKLYNSLKYSYFSHNSVPSLVPSSLPEFIEGMDRLVEKGMIWAENAIKNGIEHYAPRLLYSGKYFVIFFEVDEGVPYFFGPFARTSYEHIPEICSRYKNEWLPVIEQYRKKAEFIEGLFV